MEANNLKPVYDVSYFIKKFEAIPEGMWLIGKFFNDHGSGCVNGHCGVRSIDRGGIYITEEGKYLKKIFMPLEIKYSLSPLEIFPDYCEVAAWINNGQLEDYNQPTPKQRILAALRDIKKMQGSQNTVSSEQKAQECDATEADSSNEVGDTTLYPDLTKSLAVLPEEKKEVDILLVTP